jgi:hypothetical protein
VILARLDPAAVAAARGMIPALHHDRRYEAPATAEARPGKPVAA